MKDQKTITFLYDLRRYDLSKIFGKGNVPIANLKIFLTWSGTISSRLTFDFDQYLKHAKHFDKITHILYDKD